MRASVKQQMALPIPGVTGYGKKVKRLIDVGIPKKVRGKEWILLGLELGLESGVVGRFGTKHGQ